MFGSLPAILENLGMGTYHPPTVGKNFVAFTANALVGTANASTGLMLALSPQSAQQNSAAGLATVLDRIFLDVSADPYPKHGGVLLTLATSTPVTVDLTNVGAQSVTAGDGTFSLVYTVVLNNLGAEPVVVSPGASNAFAGPLAGTAPTFTVPPFTVMAWVNPSGWAVDSTHKNLKFDPGAAPASIAAVFGGS
jgi:hypothetical protein